MRRHPSPHVPTLESRSLHTILEGCPIGAAIMAHGQLYFANALFMEHTRLAADVEDLRVTFDDAPAGTEQAGPGGGPATLCWRAADGDERRIALVAHMAHYGGEDAVVLWLPSLADSAARQDAAHVPAPGHAAPSAAKAKSRILLVEDNEINQEIAIELLEFAGVEVQVASNGEEAVELFRQQDFDLILMDIQMPVMDGMDATRAIRASGKAGATVPILAMTAHEQDSDREKSLQAGMNAHLSKPIDPPLLYAALDTWLPKRARTPAEAPDAAPAPPDAASAPPDASSAPQQDLLSRLKGFNVRAGLTNVAGNRELYLRLLDKFANNYRNSGVSLRDALTRAAHDPAAHEEAVRLAHTAKGVSANLGAGMLAAVAGELESAIKKNAVREELFTRYESLLHEALDSIATLPQRDDARVGQKDLSSADKELIAAVLLTLPQLMESDWYGAQKKLLALTPIVEGTVASAHFSEVAMALDDFDSAGVAEKGESLLRHIGAREQGDAG